MKHHTLQYAAIVVSMSLLTAACGRKQTVASKSAEAFRQAQQKGTPIGGDAHAGHSASSAAATDTAMRGIDHATMTGMDHSTMTGATRTGIGGMDHSRMGHGLATTRASTDHSSMPGMQHGETAQNQPPMAGMDHSNMPGLQHVTVAPVASPPPNTNNAISSVRPASTLTPDPFDTPAPTSVAEAVKAAQNIPDGDVRLIVPGQDHENPPTSTGSPSSSQPAMDHSQHGSPPPTPKPAAATIYTCPMHPEVTSNKPGTCPKCGMTLVKKSR